MKRNIFISFLLHIFISFSFLLFGFLGSFMGYLAASITLFLVASIAYFYTGRLFLRKADSRLKNFFSVWLLSIAILLITILIVILANIEYTEWFEGSTFVLYLASNPMYIWSYISIGEYLGNMDIVNLLVYGHLLVLPVFPSAFIWLGMLSRRKTVK